MKFSALSLAITSALAVTACGGGGGGSDSNSNSNTTPTPSVTEKVTQIINYTGYSNPDAAKAAGLSDYENLETVICYDLSANGSCDIDEPKQTVKGNHYVTLEVDKDTDLSGVNILAINDNFAFKLPVNAVDSASTTSDSSRSEANVNPLTNLAYSKMAGSGPISGPSELDDIIGGDPSQYHAGFNAGSWDNDTALMSDILLALGYGKTFNNKLNKNTAVSELVSSVGDLFNNVVHRSKSLKVIDIIANVIAEGKSAISKLDQDPAITIQASFSSIVDGASVSFSDRTSTNKDNYQDLIYSWNFGDGDTSDGKVEHLRLCLHVCCQRGPRGLNKLNIYAQLGGNLLCQFNAESPIFVCFRLIERQWSIVASRANEYFPSLFNSLDCRRLGAVSVLVCT